jgi:hypothetical protein
VAEGEALDPEHAEDPAEAEPPLKAAEGEIQASPRIPPDRAEDYETKRFMVRDHTLAVRVWDGPVAKTYAPGEMLGKLTERVAALLKDVSGGTSPMLYAMLPGQSMTLYFGDARLDDAQTQLPYEIVHVTAERIAELIELEDDELFAHAVQMGAPAQRYDELVQFVQSEGISLEWRPRNQKPRRLPADRAQRQHVRLNAEPRLVEHPITVNGVLYRVIAEPTSDDDLGSVGIHLHRWSSRPPGFRKHRLLAHYEDPEVRDTIKAGLIGEPITARIVVRQAAPGTSIAPNRQRFILAGLERGPSEGARLGTPLEELLDDDVRPDDDDVIPF